MSVATVAAITGVFSDGTTLPSGLIFPNASFTGTLGTGVIMSGTYTPTLTNTTNIDASTASRCNYLRVGAMVTVSGKVAIDPTTNGAATVLGISLPIASNFADGLECGGVIACADLNAAGGIGGDSTNDRATATFTAGNAVNGTYRFTFTYQII